MAGRYDMRRAGRGMVFSWAEGAYRAAGGSFNPSAPSRLINGRHTDARSASDIAHGLTRGAVSHNRLVAKRRGRVGYADQAMLVTSWLELSEKWPLPVTAEGTALVHVPTKLTAASSPRPARPAAAAGSGRAAIGGNLDVSGMKAR
jgi:hypothetical protein